MTEFLRVVSNGQEWSFLAMVNVNFKLTLMIIDAYLSRICVKLHTHCASIAIEIIILDPGANIRFDLMLVTIEIRGCSLFRIADFHLEYGL